MQQKRNESARLVKQLMGISLKVKNKRAVSLNSSQETDRSGFLFVLLNSVRIWLVKASFSFYQYNSYSDFLSGQDSDSY